MLVENLVFMENGFHRTFKSLMMPDNNGITEILILRMLTLERSTT